jgi:hypothetical protein
VRPIEVKCPRCKAEIGQKCETVSPLAGWSVAPHADRRWLAEAADKQNENQDEGGQ